MAISPTLWSAMMAQLAQREARLASEKQQAEMNRRSSQQQVFENTMSMANLWGQMQKDEFDRKYKQAELMAAAAGRTGAPAPATDPRFAVEGLYAKGAAEKTIADQAALAAREKEQREHWNEIDRMGAQGEIQIGRDQAEQARALKEREDFSETLANFVDMNPQLQATIGESMGGYSRDAFKALLKGPNYQQVAADLFGGRRALYARNLLNRELNTFQRDKSRAVQNLQNARNATANLSEAQVGAIARQLGDPSITLEKVHKLVNDYAIRMNMAQSPGELRGIEEESRVLLNAIYGLAPSGIQVTGVTQPDSTPTNTTVDQEKLKKVLEGL